MTIVEGEDNNIGVVQKIENGCGGRDGNEKKKETVVTSSTKRQDIGQQQEDRDRDRDKNDISDDFAHPPNVVTLYRQYDPERDRNGDIPPGIKRMNLITDSVLYRMMLSGRVPSLMMGMTGEWIVNAVNRPVQLLPDVIACIRRVDGTDWEVKALVLDLTSSTRTATQLLGFIDDMHEAYTKHLNNELGSKIYFFDQKERNDFRGTPFDDNNDPSAKRRFEIINAPRYLSFVKLPFYSNKTFSNLCGHEVRLLQSRIEFFINNRDWFDRKGVPYQLGIMLSGEAGTGKSSSIRAIANYTKRHIINVNFSNIKTVTQLKKLFYSEELHVYQTDDLMETVKLTIPISDRIYVLEELDAIGSVVVDRRSKSSSEVTAADKIVDEITLADILQILDGNMETPGRVVIITSNYPEMLDKALIRPGRIDLSIRFGLSSAESIAEMYEKLHDKPFPKERVHELPNMHLSAADATEVMFRNFGEQGVDTMIDDLKLRACQKLEDDEVRHEAASLFLQNLVGAKHEYNSRDDDNHDNNNHDDILPLGHLDGFSRIL